MNLPLTLLGKKERNDENVVDQEERDTYRVTRACRAQRLILVQTISLAK